MPQVPLALSLSEEDFLDAYGIEKPARDTKIVFYCRSGARSASACEIARQAGYTKYVCTLLCISVLSGGEYTSLIIFAMPTT